jgi:hypothetical protein
MAEQLDINMQNLVLVSPAAYPVSSHDITYNQGFGEHIKHTWEPADSPAIQILSNALECGVFISYCEFDDPQIPVAIQKAYAETAQLKPNRKTYISHGVGNIINNNAVRELGVLIVEYLHATH